AAPAMTMHVGITYDLKDEYLALGYSLEELAEFDREATIAVLEASIQRAGHTTTRIGRASSLMQRLAHGESWDLVFNIAAGERCPRGIDSTRRSHPDAHWAGVIARAALGAR